MKKNALFIFLITILFTLRLNGCSEFHLTQEEKTFLKLHPKISVHMEDNYVPFSNINSNNKFVGYSIDYANIIANKLGVEFVYNKNENWNQAIYNLKNKKIDIIAQAIKTKERQQFALFSKDYMTYHQAIVVKDRNKHLSTINRLKGKRVGIVKGYNSEKIITKFYPQIELIGFRDNETLLNAILLDKVDVAISTHQVMQYNINTMFLKNIISIPILNNPNLSKSTEAFAIRDDYPLLHSAIQKVFYSITDDELAMLELKWFGQTNKNEINQIQLSLIEEEYIRDKKVINICIDPNWMPFEKIEDGKHIGLSAEYMQLFSAKIGIKTKLIPTKTWSETLDKAKNRECDILPLTVNTTARAKYLNFTTPYVITPVVLATKFGTVFVHDIGQIIDKKLGVVEGYFLYEMLKKEYPNIDLVEVNSIQDGLEKVQNGEIFGYLDNSAVLNYEIQQNFIKNINISGKFKYKYRLTVATRSDEPLLHQIFQKAIESIDEITKQKILNHWVRIPNKKIIDYQLIWQIMSIVFIFILLGVYRNKLLKNQNRELEKIIYKKTKDLKDLNKNLKNKVQAKTKELQDNICVFEALLDSALEGIIIFDEDGNCIEVNAMALEIYHAEDRSDMIGVNVLKFVSEDSLPIIQQHLLEDNTEPYEANYLRKNGESFPALARGKTTILHGKYVRVSAILDMTDIKHKEEVLRVAKQKAEEGTKAKSEFLANMSHEIRTPMNAIMGMSHLVLQTTLSDKQRNYIQKIDKSANNLLRIINDILDFSKIEAGKLRIENVNFSISSLISNISAIMEFKAQEKNLKLVIKYNGDMSDIFYGDNLRISQVLNNLVGNAIKFTDKGEVSLHIGRQSKNRMVFTVTDTGIGLSADNIEKLFYSFSQADASITKKYGGTGLGLAISKQLVELMGGRIWVESQDGVGSKFIFEIYIEESTNEPIEDTRSFQNSTTLLVDKNHINQETKEITIQLREELFGKLKEAVLSKQIRKCKPIVEEIDNYTLSTEDKIFFIEIKNLVEKYRFRDAISLMENF